MTWMLLLFVLSSNTSTGKAQDWERHKNQGTTPFAPESAPASSDPSDSSPPDGPPEEPWNHGHGPPPGRGWRSCKWRNHNEKHARVWTESCPGAEVASPSRPAQTVEFRCHDGDVYRKGDCISSGGGWAIPGGPISSGPLPSVVNQVVPPPGPPGQFHRVNHIPPGQFGRLSSMAPGPPPSTTTHSHPPVRTAISRAPSGPPPPSVSPTSRAPTSQPTVHCPSLVVSVDHQREQWLAGVYVLQWRQTHLSVWAKPSETLMTVNLRVVGGIDNWRIGSPRRSIYSYRPPRPPDWAPPNTSDGPAAPRAPHWAHDADGPPATPYVSPFAGPFNNHWTWSEGHITPPGNVQLTLQCSSATVSPSAPLASKRASVGASKMVGAEGDHAHSEVLDHTHSITTVELLVVLAMLLFSVGTYCCFFKTTITDDEDMDSTYQEAWPIREDSQDAASQVLDKVGGIKYMTRGEVQKMLDQHQMKTVQRARTALQMMHSSRGSIDNDRGSLDEHGSLDNCSNEPMDDEDTGMANELRDPDEEWHDPLEHVHRQVATQLLPSDQDREEARPRIVSIHSSAVEIKMSVDMGNGLENYHTPPLESNSAPDTESNLDDYPSQLSAPDSSFAGPDAIEILHDAQTIPAAMLIAMTVREDSGANSVDYSSVNAPSDNSGRRERGNSVGSSRRSPPPSRAGSVTGSREYTIQTSDPGDSKYSDSNTGADSRSALHIPGPNDIILD